MEFHPIPSGVATLDASRGGDGHARLLTLIRDRLQDPVRRLRSGVDPDGCAGMRPPCTPVRVRHALLTARTHAAAGCPQPRPLPQDVIGRR